LTQNKFLYFFFFSIIILTNTLFVRGLIDETLAPRYTFLASILLLFWILHESLKQRVITFEITDITIIAFYLIHVISSLRADNLFEAFFDTQKIFLFTILYFSIKKILMSAPKRATHILLTILLIYITVQFLLLLPQAFVFFKGRRIHKYTFIYLEGFSGNKNLLSGLLLLLVPFLMYGITYFKTFKKILSIVLLVCSIILIYFLRTRSVFLAGIYFVIVYMLIFSIKKSPNWLKKFALFIPIPIILLGVVSLFDFRLLEYIKSTGIISPGGKTGTFYERIVIWSKSILIFENNPILGVGAGNWKLNFPLVTMDGLKRAELNTSFFARPHNDFILILTELGLVGIVCYISLWYSVLKNAYIYILKKAKEHKLILFLTASLLCYLIFSCFSFPKERLEFQILFATYLAIVSHYTSVKTYSITMFKGLLITRKLILICLLGTTIILGVIRIKHESIAYTMRKAYIANDFQTLKNIATELSYNDYVVNANGNTLSFYRGISHLQTGNTQKAIKDLEIAKKANPGSLATYVNLGVAYYKENILDLAIKNYKMALQISSNHQDANYNIALAYLAKNELEKSWYHTNRLTDNFPYKQQLLRILKKYNP